MEIFFKIIVSRNAEKGLKQVADIQHSAFYIPSSLFNV